MYSTSKTNRTNRGIHSGKLVEKMLRSKLILFPLGKEANRSSKVTHINEKHFFISKLNSTRQSTFDCQKRKAYTAPTATCGTFTRIKLSLTFNY